MRWAVVAVVVGYVVVWWANAREGEHNSMTGRVAAQPILGVFAGRIGGAAPAVLEHQPGPNHNPTEIAEGKG